jgi:hypothetical protein
LGEGLFLAFCTFIRIGKISVDPIFRHMRSRIGQIAHADSSAGGLRDQIVDNFIRQLSTDGSGAAHAAIDA